MPDIATLGLELDATGLVTGSVGGRTALKGVTGAAYETEGALGQATKAAVALGLTFGAYRAAQWAQDTLNLGARYETLGVTMDVVGKNAGRTSAQMDALQASLQKTGISMLESRQNLARMASAELDLGQATQLARIAQDAAVIANLNSSESFEQLIRGITTGMPRILRTMGIYVDFNSALEAGAKAMGKNVQALTEVESSQIRANAVIESGARIAGTYEAAMATAGKQLRSTERYLEDARVKVSEAFQPAYTALVFDYANALKFAGQHAEGISTTLKAMLALFGAKVVAEATARLSEYNAGLAATAAANLAEARAVAQANQVELYAANVRLGAMRNRLAAETALGASTERLVVLENELALAQTRVTMTAEAAAASEAALAAASTTAGAALSGAATVAKGAWAAIGGPIGAAVIGAIALNTLIDKYLEKKVKENELTAEEQALWEKTQKIWADRKAAQDKAAEDAKKAAEEAKALQELLGSQQVELARQKDLVAAYGQTDQAIALINLKYDEQAALLKNAEDHSGRQLAALNAVTKAIFDQKRALVELQAQQAVVDVQQGYLNTQGQMLGDVSGQLLGLQAEVRERERVLAATKEGKDAVDALTISLAGEQAMRLALAAGLPGTAEEIRKLAEEYARLGIEIDKAKNAEAEAEKAERERIRHLEQTIRLTQEIATATVDFAHSLGVLSTSGQQTLDTLIQLGTSIARLSAGDLTAIPGVIGSAGSLLGSLFNNDSSRQAEIDALHKNQEAVAKLTAATDKLRDTYEGTPSSIMQTYNDARRTAQRRETPQEADARAQAERDAAIQRVTERYNQDLKLRQLQAQGLDDQAAALEFNIKQQREWDDAVRAGWDAVTLSALANTQAMEKQAFAAQQAADAAKKLADQIEKFRSFAEDLTVRGLNVTGQTNAAALAQLNYAQRRERAQAIADNQSPANLAFLDGIQKLERDALVRQQADQTQIDAINKAAQAAQDAAQVQTEALQKQLQVAEDQLRTQQQTVDSLQRVVDSLGQFAAGLPIGTQSPLSPISKLDEARRQFEAMRALALQGDATAGASLPDAIRSLLDASKAVNASGPGYVSDYQRAQDSVEAVRRVMAGELTDQQKILAELGKQTSSMQAQIDALQAAAAQAKADADAQIAQIQEAARKAQQDAAEQLALLQQQVAALRALMDLPGIHDPVIPPPPFATDTLETTINSGNKQIIAELRSNNARLTEANDQLQATVSVLAYGFKAMVAASGETRQAFEDGAAATKRALEDARVPAL